jgi:hypothetical protein
MACSTAEFDSVQKARLINDLGQIPRQTVESGCFTTQARLRQP